MIILTINGEEKTIDQPLALTALLELLQVNPEMVVVEHNQSIISQPDFNKVVCQDKDQIEIVQFMGGG